MIMGDFSQDSWMRRGRQEPAPNFLREPDSFGGRSEPPKAVITRECPRDSLGLLSPLRCFASYTATLIHRIFRVRSLALVPGCFSKAILSFILLYVFVNLLSKQGQSKQANPAYRFRLEVGDLLWKLNI